MKLDLYEASRVRRWWEFWRKPIGRLQLTGDRLGVTWKDEHGLWRPERSVDLSRSFGVQVQVWKASRRDVIATISLSQGIERTSFAARLKRADVPPDVPLKMAKDPELSPRDFWKVWGKVQEYARAHGVPLPRLERGAHSPEHPAVPEVVHTAPDYEPAPEPKRGLRSLPWFGGSGAIFTFGVNTYGFIVFGVNITGVVCIGVNTLGVVTVSVNSIAGLAAIGVNIATPIALLGLNAIHALGPGNSWFLSEAPDPSWVAVAVASSFVAVGVGVVAYFLRPKKDEHEPFDVIRRWQARGFLLGSFVALAHNAIWLLPQGPATIWKYLDDLGLTFGP